MDRNSNGALPPLYPEYRRDTPIKRLRSSSLQLAVAELGDPESFADRNSFNVRRRPQIELANRLPSTVEMLPIFLLSPP